MKGLLALIVALCAASEALAGAWGEGSFENDEALDWVSELGQSRGVTLVSAALRTAAQAKTIDASVGAEAIAAAEVVAAALGHPSRMLPSEVIAWEAHESKKALAALAPLAQRAVSRVKDDKSSELRNSWSEAKTQGWAQQVADLQARLMR